MPITMKMLHVEKLRAPAGPIPPGLKAVAMGSGSFERDALTPVLTVGGFRLWPFSYHDNRGSFGLVLYDPAWRVLGQLEKPGARYIYKLTHDDDAGEISFWGQGAERAVLKLEELAALLGPHEAEAAAAAVADADARARPVRRGAAPRPAYADWEPTPRGLPLPLTMEMLKVVAMAWPPGPLPSGLAGGSGPVLSFGDFTLWPLSYFDNRVSFGMVVYDGQGRVRAQSERPGARYIAGIELDNRRQTITFRGQADETVVMRLGEVAMLLI